MICDTCDVRKICERSLNLAEPFLPKQECLEKEYKRLTEYNCVLVKVKDHKGKEFNALYDKSRELLFTTAIDVAFAKATGWVISELKGE